MLQMGLKLATSDLDGSTEAIVNYTFSCGYGYGVCSTVRVENFEVFLISRFSWVADDTKIIHVEGGINTREIFGKILNCTKFSTRTVCVLNYTVVHRRTAFCLVEA